MSLLDEDIREEFKKTRSYFRVARSLGVSLDKVKSVISHELPTLYNRPARYPADGRIDLQQYLVAKKHVLTDWNNDQIEIAKARADYEAGTHDMATGRDGDYNFLYSFPLAVKSPRLNYFKVGYDAF